MPIVACRPVDVAPLFRLAPHIPVPDPHKGSIIGRCQTCNEEVWIGPEQDKLVQQAMVERNLTDPVIVVCLLCAIKAMHDLGLDADRVQRLSDKETPFRNADGTINPTFGKEEA